MVDTAQPAFGYKERFAESLRKMVLPANLCAPHPDNARLHNLPAIAQSLRDYGQQTPIVVQATTGFIVKGNGTWEAATRLLNWQNLAQSWEDFDDQTAIGYLLADNKSSDSARYEKAKVTKLLRQLANADQLQLSGWTADELDDYEVGETPLLTEIEQFTGGYADAGTEEQAERKAKEGRTGEKMREMPIVLTTADAAEFTGWVDELAKHWGASGRIATIFRAVKEQAAIARGDIAPDYLKTLRDFFSTHAQDAWTRPQLIAFFESNLRPALLYSHPENDLRQVAGQTTAFDAEATEASVG